jgi:hypothetical protein
LATLMTVNIPTADERSERQGRRVDQHVHGKVALVDEAVDHTRGALLELCRAGHLG